MHSHLGLTYACCQGMLSVLWFLVHLGETLSGLAARLGPVLSRDNVSTFVRSWTVVDQSLKPVKR